MNYAGVLLDNLAVIVEAISGIGAVILAGVMGFAVKALRKQKPPASQASGSSDTIHIGLGTRGNVTAAHITKHPA